MANTLMGWWAGILESILIRPHFSRGLFWCFCMISVIISCGTRQFKGTIWGLIPCPGLDTHRPLCRHLWWLQVEWPHCSLSSLTFMTLSGWCIDVQFVFLRGCRRKEWYHYPIFHTSQNAWKVVYYCLLGGNDCPSFSTKVQELFWKILFAVENHFYWGTPGSLSSNKGRYCDRANPGRLTMSPSLIFLFDPMNNLDIAWSKIEIITD